jgi:ribonuclease T1
MRRLLLAFWLVCLALLGVAEARQQPGAAATDAIEWIEQTDLPREARVTLQLIESGGPFPYPRDGIVFRNYEKRLPLKPRGYYREYTVPTPGARNRGARRIISGHTSERYYTADHYLSFRRIRQ